MKHLLLILTSLVVIQGCSKKNGIIEQNSDKVLIKENDQLLLLEITDSNIIHVQYSVGNKMPAKKSHIVDSAYQSSDPWNIVEDDSSYTLTTAALVMKISRPGLKISWYDTSGNPILSEISREIKPNVINGDKTTSVRQQFETSEDEGIYGMGQSQIGRMNLRGQDLDLYQRNMEVYIPYMVSTKGYGILWDNYSHTKFGSLIEPEYIPHTVFKDMEGRENKLSCEFYKLKNFTEKVNFQGWEGKNLLVDTLLPDSINAVRLSGKIVIANEGEYRFYKEFSGQLKLWIDGKLLSDYWHLFSRDKRITYTWLTKGEHDITIELSSRKDDPVTLRWKTPSMIETNLSLWSTSGNMIDYYFVKSNTMDGLVAGYRKLTGACSMLPKWSFGLWQCKERYKTQEEIVNVVKEYRKRKIPLDNIVQDWFYWKSDQWGSHEFDPERYPDPARMVKDIHAMNAQIMISVWGKFYLNTEHFKELQQKGFTYENFTRDSITDWMGFPYSYYDAYSAPARELFWKRMNEKLYSLGFDAWWMDASEPELKGDISADKKAYYMEPNALGKGYDYLNLYPLYNSKGIYEGQRAVNPNTRVFNLTRSAFAGMQKYAATTWSGDIVGSWQVYKNQIAAGLNFSLSGMPYWTTDIGGFFAEWREGVEYDYDEYKELFTRWFQFGTFCPLFRVHGSNTPREMWCFGEKNYQVQLAFDKLRYDLMPYIYSLSAMVTREHSTMMRALVMDFPADKKVINIDDQFMFGPSILVNPVTKYQARERAVYLPQCKGWYDFWDGYFHEGGQRIDAKAPMERIPLYVKAGSIIPFGPAIQYTDEKPAELITLRVYEGDNATFTLYEDDGRTYDFEKGEYSTILFEWKDSTKELVIHERTGEYKGMINERTFEIFFISPTIRKGYSTYPEAMRTVRYTGERLLVK